MTCSVMYYEFPRSCTQNFLPGENAGGAPVHVQPQPGKGAIGEGRPLLHIAMGTIQVRLKAYILTHTHSLQ